MLAEIITEIAAKPNSTKEIAALIVQQMAHWPRLSSERGWIVAIEALLANTDKVAAQLAAAQARIAELERHILMLTKLPTWQPVEDGFEYAYEGRRLHANGGDLEMNNDANEGDRWVILPDDLRLCRFTPADWVDWEKVPLGYDWVAGHPNGDVFAYSQAPQRQPTYWWIASDSGMTAIPGTLPLGIDWRQSLRRRPTT